MEGVERRWGVEKTGEELPRVHTELDENPVGPPASPGLRGLDWPALGFLIKMEFVPITSKILMKYIKCVKYTSSYQTLIHA